MKRSFTLLLWLLHVFYMICMYSLSCLPDLSTVPGPVASVYGEPLSPTSIRIGWSPPAHPNGIVTGYRIQYSHVNNGSTESSVDVHATSMNLTLTELSPSTRYRVSVAAQTSIGVGQVTTIELVTDSSC